MATEAGYGSVEPLACPTCARKYPLSERFCADCEMPLVYVGRGEEEPITAAHERARKVKPQYLGGELVKVAMGSNLAEAELIQGILLEEGIPSVQRRTRGFDVPDFLAAGPRDIMAILVWRIWLPLWRSARYRLRVVGIVRESSDVISVYLTGRQLDRLPLQAGQFINVRFLSRPGWTRANPFSLSIAPNGHTLRITAKALGGDSARLAYLRPGTRVLFEGPYGRLSSRARTQRRVLLAGAGVGITPLRALAEGLEYAPGEAIILQRYTAEPLFTRELDELAAAKGLQVVHLPGPRRTQSSVLGPAAGGIPELIALRRWIPDLADRDVFLCGPSAWTEGVARLALAAGVPSGRIHSESFGW